MNRQTLKNHLAEVERQLAELAVRIEKQRALLRRLEASRRDTAAATFLLEQALGLQKLHESHRERLTRELEQKL